MIVVSRFRVAEDRGGDFLTRARLALAAFADRPGFARGRVGRAADDPTWWTLTTEWESVGAFRRSLSAFEVKVNAAPLLAESTDEPAAFEVLAAYDGPAEVAGGGSDRAADAGRTRAGETAEPDPPRAP